MTLSVGQVVVEIGAGDRARRGRPIGRVGPLRPSRESGAISAMVGGPDAAGTFFRVRGRGIIIETDRTW